VLDFQGFAVLQFSLQWLCSGFAETTKSLSFSALPTSRKYLFINAFTHFAVLGGSRVGR
jgi:hypothetical protein